MCVTYIYVNRNNVAVQGVITLFRGDIAERRLVHFVTFLFLFLFLLLLFLRSVSLLLIFVVIFVAADDCMSYKLIVLS
jgi:hypothetical protein